MDLFCARLFFVSVFLFMFTRPFTSESPVLNNTEPSTGSSCSDCDLYCKNEGTCHCPTVGFNDNVMCECLPSFTGQHCEVFDNEIKNVSTVSTVSDDENVTFAMTTQPTSDQCADLCNLPWYKDYCYNGGSCRCPSGFISFPTCECPPSHVGPRCKTIADSSVTVPVIKEHTSNATTAVTSTTPKTSQPCPRNACDLYGNQCKNGATCVRNCDVHGYVSCNCIYPYTGLTCSDILQTDMVTQVAMQETATTSLGNSQCGLQMPDCKNGEVNYESNNTVICKCHQHWTGELCDKPCQKNCSFGDCTEVGCVCWENYAKDNATGACTIYMPECASRMPHCKNGTVKCAGGKASCKCHQNWTGEWCDKTCERICCFGTCTEVKVNDIQCECWTYYKKDDDGVCTIYMPPTPQCLLNCSLHGDCVKSDVNQTEICACWRNYTGDFCETFSPLEGAPTPTWLISVLLALVMLFVVMLIVVPYIMYKKRVELILKIAYYFRQYEDDDGKEYDAFVSYCSSGIDEQFVVRTLRPKLEDEFHLKLCLHFRDFSPGELIMDNITRSIERSRRSILVISPRYLDSAYCRMEYQLAHEEMIRLRHKVIPVVFEDISDVKDIDKYLKMLLKTVTYEKWPGHSEEKSADKFWRKILLSMPKKRLKVENISLVNKTVSATISENAKTCSYRNDSLNINDVNTNKEILLCYENESDSNENIDISVLEDGRLNSCKKYQLDEGIFQNISQASLLNCNNDIGECC